MADINPNESKYPEYFKIFKKDKIKFKYTTDVLWGKVNFENTSEQTVTRRFWFTGTLSSYIDFYVNGEVLRTGSSLAFDKRYVEDFFSYYDVSLKPGDSQTVYFKKYGTHAFSSKLILSTIDDFTKYKNYKENVFKIYIGGILALILYNLIFAIFFKSKKYYVYCAFAFTLMSAAINLQGYLDFINIFPNHTISHYLIVNTCIAIIAALEFGYMFLDAKTYLKEFLPFRKIIYGLCSVPVLLTLTPFYDDYVHYFGFYIDVIVLVCLILLIILSIVAKRRSSPLAGVYIISWGFLFFGALIYFGQLHGTLSKNLITENGILISNTFEMIILSLGLAYQIVILDKRNKEAEILTKEKNKYQQLLRTLSHDILNSLQVVISGSRRLGRLIEDDRHLMIVDKINSSSRNVVEILEQVKAQERLESDKEKIKLEKVHLVEILNENFQIFEDRMTKKNIIIKTDIDSDAQVVIAERVSLKNNVIGNILSNAIKFSPNNSVIQVKAKSEEDSIVLTIKDEGDGFNSEALSVLQGKDNVTVSTSGTSGETGTGFGLKIIMSYIELYNAKIHVFNDQGAVFTLTFQKPR